MRNTLAYGCDNPELRLIDISSVDGKKIWRFRTGERLRQVISLGDEFIYCPDMRTHHIVDIAPHDGRQDRSSVCLYVESINIHNVNTGDRLHSIKCREADDWRIPAPPRVRINIDDNVIAAACRATNAFTEAALSVSAGYRVHTIGQTVEIEEPGLERQIQYPPVRERRYNPVEIEDRANRIQEIRLDRLEREEELIKQVRLLAENRGVPAEDLEAFCAEVTARLSGQNAQKAAEKEEVKPLKKRRRIRLE